MSDVLDTSFENVDIDLDGNFVEIGDDYNIRAKDPSLHKIMIAAGWDANAFNADILDMDMSLFLLNKDGTTRVDEDFVFYNQTKILDGAVQHHGDSRTGAGDGDDEVISIDLQGVPFDVLQIAIVLSVYKGFEKEQNLSMVRNTYVRLVNEENEEEILRYKLDPDLVDKEETAVIAAFLNREGPKWHFKPVAELVEKGLGELARRYGMIINQE